MVIYNAATRELTAKIVYYGPGLGGKTTNLHLLHERLEPATVGKLLNLATQTDRTIYFDLLPVELGDIKGYKIRFQLATVPGQTAFNETRRVVLKGTDGIVFVADSQWSMLPKNLESWQNLKDNLKANGVSFEGIPIVVQYNKRDLSDVLSIDALQEALGLSSYPFVEAVASAGRGVTETFKLISKLTFVDLLRRLQGRRPEEAGAPPPRREPDDLLSWKDSLLNRAASAAAAPAASTDPAARRPFQLVPAISEEAPFETGEDSGDHAEGELEADAPFGGAGGRPRFVEAPATLDALSLPAMPEIDAPPSHDAAEREMAAGVVTGDEHSENNEAAPGPEPSAFEIAAPAAAAAHEGSEPPAIAAQSRPEGPAPAEEPAPAAVLRDGRDGERILALERRLDEALAALSEERQERERAAEESRNLVARLEAFERDARSLGKTLGENQQAAGERVESLARAISEHVAVAARVSEIHERLTGSEKRQRTAEDDVSMALRSLSDRGEKVNQRVESLSEQAGALAGRLEQLDGDLREKTAQNRREADDIRSEIESLRALLDDRIGQGRRESEDIRGQIAPLLEAHAGRGASDHRLSQEFDGLRESLAESLADLSERLRRAVRGS